MTTSDLFRFLTNCLRALCLAALFLFVRPVLWSAAAAPSCGLETWLQTLNDSANSYLSALGGPGEYEAARRFRTEMERYDRDQLLKQIREAELGANEQALMDYISSRRHLLNLHEENWSEMATRYGSDPRFDNQAQSLNRYLNATPCDPTAPNFLNPTPEKDGNFINRLIGGLDEISTIVQHEEATPPPIDPMNFDEFLPNNTRPSKPPTIALSPSGNAAFVLGLFTFFTAMSSWGWMRYGIVQRRAIRYPCTLPVELFDGIVPVTGELLDISQIGAKIETNLQIPVRAKLKISCGPMERKAKVIWRNNHFIGVKFERSLSETEMKELLGHYATEIAQEREEARSLGLTLPRQFPETNLPEQTDQQGPDTKIAPRSPDDVQADCLTPRHAIDMPHPKEPPEAAA